MAARRSTVEDRLAQVARLSEDGGPTLSAALRPFLQDRTGLVVAAAASAANRHGLEDVAGDLESAFARLLVDPVKTDPGCRGKLAAAEALRMLEIRAPDVYLRGVAYRQPEASWGPPIDTAAPLRVCCGAALLERRYPWALLEVAPLLADPEANARAGIASVLGCIGTEASEALLRLKALQGDADPAVVGACLEGLLRSSLERHLSFVLEAMDSAGEDVVRLAMIALGETRDERAFAALRGFAESTVDAEVRKTALLAMSLSRLPAANAYLLGLVEQAPERRAVEAVRALKSQQFDAALVERIRGLAAGRGGAVLEAFARFVS